MSPEVARIPRSELTRSGFKAPRQSVDYRNRPSTAAPQFYPSGGDSNRSHSAIGFAPGGVRAQSAMGYGAHGPGVKNNLE